MTEGDEKEKGSKKKLGEGNRSKTKSRIGDIRTRQVSAEKDMYGNVINQTRRVLV